MTDEQLISELGRLAGQADPHARATYDQVTQTIKQRAVEYQQSNQHWRSISLLGRARKAIEPLTDLDRMMALVLGSEAELFLGWADRLRIAPSAELLSEIEAGLGQAIKADPTVGDAYWDLATIKARFQADYAAAAEYLEAATAKGCAHPMMRRLEALIHDKPPLPSPDTAKTRLRQLILQLAVQAAGPMYGSLVDEDESNWLDEEKGGPARLATFGDYVREAKAAVVNDPLSEGEYLEILSDCIGITGDSSEYAADLLRRVATVAGGELFISNATDSHLRLILAQALQHFESRQGDPAGIRKSLRAAKRGLKIIEESGAAIDPDLHADLLIAMGQALYYTHPSQATEAIRCYQKALRLKRQAENAAEVEKMRAILWKQVDYRVGQALFAQHIGGIGEALENLKVCADVADDLDDLPRAMGINLVLASVLRQVGQYDEAEQILVEIIGRSPPEKVARGAKFELASVFSETFRPKEAAEIQRPLLEEGGMDDDQQTAVLWSNYANSLSLLKDFEGARVALEKAWELLPPEQKLKIDNTVPDQGARIKTLRAELELKQGTHAEAINHIEAAEALVATPLGLDGLHFNAIKARCLIAVGRYDEARKCLDTAIHNLGFLLEHGPSLTSWESLLRHWSHLDVMAVRAHISSGETDGAENAFLRAESAKGRVLAWIEHWFAPKGAEWALALERQVKALAKARAWLAQRPNRRIVSLFGSHEGLGVFNVDGSGRVTCAWLADVDYDLFRRDSYDPWEKLTERALTDADPEVLATAGSLTDHLLNSVGTWLWRAHPNLADGGTDLVIIPHRLFRSLPLAQVQLPTGRRLSDLFDRVVIATSLGDWERASKASPYVLEDLPITALADANKNQALPFARCEAILSGAGDNLLTGDAVTSDVVAKAFGREGILLLSLHGDFDEANPFQSIIFAADGEVRLDQMLGQSDLKSRIVVLGICEAGRSRRSLSDEPMGFPAMLLQGGVAAVLAPAWRVDDFASFLFISELFAAFKRSNDVFRAVRDTTRWLREATAQTVLERIDNLLAQVMECGDLGKMTVESLQPRLDSQKEWLKTLDPTERPFRSPLDWAPFQISGVPPANVPQVNKLTAEE